MQERIGMCDNSYVAAVFLLQVPKPEKHGSGTDSDYDNTQMYDTSVRSVFKCKSAVFISPARFYLSRL